MAPSEQAMGTDALPLAVLGLMKGVCYREDQPALWQSVLNSQLQVRDYIAVIGLELVLDEIEGYAYLRQRVPAPGELELPRLVPRRPLPYAVSLLLVLLRRKLAEFDATSGDTRLVLSLDEIADLVRLFLPASSNEARLLDRLSTDVKKVVELGFLKPLRGQEDHYEVRRILKTFVDAQWIGDLNERLAAYRDHAMSGRAGGGEES